MFDVDAKPLVPVTFIAQEDSDGLLEFVTNKSFGYGLQWHAWITTHNDRILRITLGMSHVISDGIAMLRLVRSVLFFASSPVPVPVSALDLEQPIEQLIDIEDEEKRKVETQTQAEPNYLYRRWKAARGLQYTHIYTHIFRRDLVERLLSFCKARRVAFSTMFGGCALRAMELQGSATVNIPIHLGHLATSLSPSYFCCAIALPTFAVQLESERSPEAQLTEQLRSIQSYPHHLIREMRRTAEVPFPQLLLDKARRHVCPTDEVPWSAIVSSKGQFDFGTFSDFRVRASFCGHAVHGSGTPVHLSFHTHEGRLFFTSSWASFVDDTKSRHRALIKSLELIAR